MKYFSIFIFYFLFFIFYSLPVHAATWTVCSDNNYDTSCSHKGAEGLQSAVNEAKNGDTISIKGEIAGPVFHPFDGRMNVTYCFVDLKGKNLTLKGGKLFGDGHNIARTVEPPGDENNSRYYHRAAICSKGGKIIIDSMDIDEFEGGGMQFWDAEVILKNNIIQGHDHGAVFLFNSSVLAVNNNFVSNIGLIPFGQSSIYAYNNTFYNSKAIVASVSCNDDVPDLKFINNIVVDTELTIGIGGLTTNCPEKVDQFKQRKIENNLLWKQGRDWYPHEYQADFPGKIVADPVFPENLGVYVGGLHWGELKPESSSPAIGAGNSNIPGPNVLGSTGGPCVDGNSAACTQFIEANLPPLSQPPTAPPDVQQPSDNQQPSEQNNNNTGIPDISSSTITKFSNLSNLNYGSFTTQSSQRNQGISFVTFVILAVVFIMIIHFVIEITNEFNVFLMIGYFVLGGVIGWWLESYESGLILSIVLTLLSW